MVIPSSRSETLRGNEPVMLLGLNAASWPSRISEVYTINTPGLISDKDRRRRELPAIR